jgi:hypothetical protein
VNRALFLFTLAIPAFAVAACSGGILPVAQDGADSGVDGGGGGGSSGTSSGGSSSGGSSGTSSGGSSSGGSSSGGLDGGGACPADAGGNACLCGPLICVAGQWTCGSCNLDAGAAECNPPCGVGSVCVKDQVNGGAVFLLQDGGTCPAGRHPNGDHCDRDPTFACAPAPSCALDCTCAATLCTGQSSCGYTCESTTSSQVNCACNVP